MTIGRGTIGGRLARLRQEAGHDVEELGRGGDDASDADAVLVAVPRAQISAALGEVGGLEGKVAIDATNSFPSRHGKFGFYA
ncbi:hypothetical protein OG456_34950 [Streptomyces sp. NBC_01446]|nr:hypothetical protein [Streptomyces sp. NBC_00120]MCX4647550.1 hypothetical protein [Streptomyces sp. NBC_01446]